MKVIDQQVKKANQKKKKLNKRGVSSDSSSEEDEKEGIELKSTPTTLTKKVSTPVIQQIEGTLPKGQQKNDDLNEGTLPKVQSSRTKTHEVTTRLLNNFFQRDSVEQEEISGKEQKINRLVKWWVGTKTLPLVDHSVKDEENIIGQQQYQNKLPWGAGIWTALWLLWLAISAGIYPIYPNAPVEEYAPSQTGKKEQTKRKLENKITGQSGSQTPDDTSRKARKGKSGRMRARSQDTESEDFEESN